MPTIQVDATANITPKGTTVAYGTITWAEPSLPTGITSWDSVTISGTWSWNSKGAIRYVTINGTNTTTGVAFNIPLDTTVTSPLSISCVGNKNATAANGFAWSNLVITYTYAEPASDVGYLKLNGSYHAAASVYKKVNNVWTIQNDLETVFEDGKQYVLVSS